MRAKQAAGKLSFGFARVFLCSLPPSCGSYPLGLSILSFFIRFVAVLLIGEGLDSVDHKTDVFFFAFSRCEESCCRSCCCREEEITPTLRCNHALNLGLSLSNSGHRPRIISLFVLPLYSAPITATKRDLQIPWAPVIFQELSGICSIETLGLGSQYGRFQVER
ncbi:hypothetical protein BDW72DRAFT_55119 [Aspergillus terricola var. indicus]